MEEDSDREVAIFAQALKVAPQERDAFLEQACGGDANLRRRLKGLLEAYNRLGHFLEEPPIGGSVG